MILPPNIGVMGLGFRVWGLGFGVQGSGFRGFIPNNGVSEPGVMSSFDVHMGL